MTSAASRKNENGVYLDYRTEVVARRGRSVAEVDIAQCDDGLFRFSISVWYSSGGFSGPITDDGDGYQTYEQAKTAGLRNLLERFPTAWASEPQSVHDELLDLREQIERQIQQPTLF